MAGGNGRDLAVQWQRILQGYRVLTTTINYTWLCPSHPSQALTHSMAGRDLAIWWQSRGMTKTQPEQYKVIPHHFVVVHTSSGMARQWQRHSKGTTELVKAWSTYSPLSVRYKTSFFCSMVQTRPLSIRQHHANYTLVDNGRLPVSGWYLWTMH